MKKILFLSTLNLATNPRLVKEIRLALIHQYKVEVICFEFNNWSFAINQQIKKELRAEAVVIHAIEAGRKPLFNWLYSLASEFSSRWLVRIIPFGIHLIAQALSRRHVLLIQELRKITEADWVVGHNPGAMGATLSAAKKLNCKAAFDVEDYHPGEGHDKQLQFLARKLMQYCLPKMNYVSFSSSLIMDAVKRDLQQAPMQKCFTVLNYFPAAEFIEPEAINGRIKLVWFSQNIDAGRGIELILPSVKEKADEIELHFYGDLNSSFYDRELKNIPNIIVHHPVSQNDLHKELSGYDIGLALDIPLNINRDLALTNKLLVYLQVGFYVLATNTKAQQSALDSFPLHGKCFDFKENNFNKLLDIVLANKHEWRMAKEARFKYFKNTHSWETESIPLLQSWV